MYTTYNVYTRTSILVYTTNEHICAKFDNPMQPQRRTPPGGSHRPSQRWNADSLNIAEKRCCFKHFAHYYYYLPVLKALIYKHGYYPIADDRGLMCYSMCNSGFQFDFLTSLLTAYCIICSPFSSSHLRFIFT